MNNEKQERFDAQKADIQTRAAAMLDVLVSPQFKLGKRIECAEERKQAVMDAADNSMLFSSIKNTELRHKIALLNAEAIEDYAQHHNDTAPPAEMLACAHAQIETCFNTSKAEQGVKDSMLLSSISDSIQTSDGVDAIAVTAALALPLMVANPMNDIVTYLPVKRYKTEVFELRTIAASTLGDVKEDDDLTHMHNGQYSQMRQRYDFPEKGDGTKKAFAFDTELHTPAKKALPFVKGSVKVYANREVITKDDGDGDLSGKIIIGGTKHNVNGTYDHKTGKINIDVAVALPAEVILTAEYEIDIESNTDLIPSISHKLTSFYLRPFQRTIAANATIQSMFKMFTEHGVDIASFNMRALRHYLSSEKAYSQLRDLMWYADKEMNYDAAVPNGESKKDHYEFVRKMFLGCDNEIKKETGDSGLKGIYAGRDMCVFIRMLPSSLFKEAPNYEHVAGIHYVGMLLGFIKVFECPDETVVPADEALAYGKSKELGKAPYYTGDVVPPMVLKETTKRGFDKEQVLYALGYDDINPNHGRKYLRLLKLDNFKVNDAA